MSTHDLSPDAAAYLDRLAPADPIGAPDWSDVLGRTAHDAPGSASRRQRHSRRTLLVAAAVAVLVLAAGIATAAYLSLDGPSIVVGARPTIVTTNAGYQRIVVLDASGGETQIWECPGRAFCGNVVSMAWAPHGNRLAITLDEIGGLSSYVGVRILDFDRGTDTRIPQVPAGAPLEVVGRATRRAFGCVNPNRLGWSPDGTRLAYVCPEAGGTSGRPTAARESPGWISTIRADGTEGRRLSTGLGAVADFPTWSRDGRIAFEARRAGRSSIYVIGVDGRGRRLVVQDAAAPVWSPDGTVLAYLSLSPDCPGVRLIPSEVVGVAPLPAGCTTFGPQGIPAWSADSRRLTIATAAGIYVVDRGRAGPPSRITTQTGSGSYGAASPTWTPAGFPPRPRTLRTVDGCERRTCY